MKVVAINGSPNKNGNTAFAIETVANELKASGIEVEVLHIGKDTIHGCIACGGCGSNKNEKCVLPGDHVNEYIQKMKEADGIIFRFANLLLRFSRYYEIFFRQSVFMLQDQTETCSATRLV